VVTITDAKTAGWRIRRCTTSCSGVGDRNRGFVWMAEADIFTGVLVAALFLETTILPVEGTWDGREEKMRIFELNLMRRDAPPPPQCANDAELHLDCKLDNTAIGEGISMIIVLASEYHGSL
jgi:hypothetical protein